MNIYVIAGVVTFVYLLMTFRRVPEATGAETNLLKNILDNYGGFAESISVETNVPTTLILSVIRMESAGDPDARGSIGEVGLMQLTEAAWEDITRFSGMAWRVTGIPRDPYSNILAGTHYLLICNERMGGSIEVPHWFDALRAYNVGASRAFAGVRGTNYASRVEAFQRLFERGL